MKAFLQVALADVPVGTIGRDATGALVLEFDPVWQQQTETIPLSLALPRTEPRHRGAVVQFFFDALLPDHDVVRVRWGREHDVDGTDILALLGVVGEDLPGAVQVRPMGRRTRAEPEAVEWLAVDGVALLLSELRRDETAWHGRGEGAFSLGGAQRKTALLHRDGRWGRPLRRTPSTHILKPGIGEGFPGYADVEHFCLRLAANAGLRAAGSQLLTFGAEVAVVVERFDRLVKPGRILRLHQEDICQALGRDPRRRYAAEGAPTAGEIAAMLWSAAQQPRRAVEAFADCLTFQWLIAGTDAHARNYSIMHSPSGVELSPLYDVASVLPFTRDTGSPRLAMRIGGSVSADAIGPAEWHAEGVAIGLGGEAMVARVRKLAQVFPEAIAHTRAELSATVSVTTMTTRLANLLEQRCAQCVERMK